MIAYFSNEQFLGSYDGIHSLLPSYHFFCPSCGVIWARIICEPGDAHRVVDTPWCTRCARTTPEGIWDGVIDVYWFPEFVEAAPTPVLIHNFMQLYDNRLRLDAAGIKVQASVRYWDDNSELLARLQESA